MTTSARILLLALTGWATACSQQTADEAAPDGASLILINARVYTLDWDEPALDGTPMAGAPITDTGWYPDAEAVVIAGGDIEFVGDTREALEYQGEATRVVDVAGATVIPGLVDSHTHVYGLGARLDSIDLTSVQTEEEAVALVVNGFVRDVLQQLPMEFMAETQKLIGISLEGSVG